MCIINLTKHAQEDSCNCFSSSAYFKPLDMELSGALFRQKIIGSIDNEGNNSVLSFIPLLRQQLIINWLYSFNFASLPKLPDNIT